MFNALRRKIGDLRLSQYQREQEKQKREREQYKKELEAYEQEKALYEQELERERARVAFQKQRADLRQKRGEIRQKKFSRSKLGKAVRGVEKFARYAAETGSQVTGGLDIGGPMGGDGGIFGDPGKPASKSKKKRNDDYLFPL